MANEFDLIQTYFQPLSKGLSESELGIGDDGAVLNAPLNKQLVVVTDAMVSGVHFPEDTAAYDIGWKALAVNLSDLAAMGAQPAFFSLALTLPEADETWLAEFAQGLSDLAHQQQVPLIGGDTTKGPLCITVTAQGWVGEGQAVLRSGAKENDLICVTNTIGDAALGLKFALNQEEHEADISTPEFSEKEVIRFIQALNCPQPQNAFAGLLCQFASSAIDISDGLLADVSHILERSNQSLDGLDAIDNQISISAQIDLEKIPLSKGMQKYLQVSQNWSPILHGGDDYELCFTLADEAYPLFKLAAEQAGLSFAVIGKMVAGKGEVILRKEGEKLDDLYQSKQGVSDKENAFSSAGYLHFK